MMEETHPEDEEDEEETKRIPYLEYIWVKCEDCGYEYNPTHPVYRHRHRAYVKEQKK